MTSRLITVDPEIHSGTPVFAGTRVPVKTLFDHLEAGDSLEALMVCRKLGRAADKRRSLGVTKGREINSALPTEATS